ncbi:hypothetical protein DSL64_13720 [Dyadobacter luteus]|uniref:Uncharacterized protein n=1 Tax=Dyadobacter luteus TaxID=2259619 RepID=A0A3D8YBU2_9BACT|nr:hypothetical protein [Dyadobacter luteus]REA60948.1 hypothetical protein DSL64_13720 [Dyadobacter luteus]
MLKTIVFDYFSGNRRKVVSLLDEKNLSYVETSSISGFINSVGFNSNTPLSPVILLLGDRSSYQEVISLTTFISRHKPGVKFFVYACDESIRQVGLSKDNCDIFQGDEIELIGNVQRFVSLNDN